MGSIQGGEQAFEQPAPVRAAEQGFEQAFGMGHHAQHAPAAIADAGNVALCAIGIGGGGDLTRRVDVTKDHAALGLELLKGGPIGKIVAFPVR